jgi:hypothetical protein
MSVLLTVLAPSQISHDKHSRQCLFLHRSALLAMLAPPRSELLKIFSPPQISHRTAFSAVLDPPLVSILGNACSSAGQHS